MNRPTISLCSALPLGDGVPEWVQLLPANLAYTVDGRGPYRVKDAAALMAASLKPGQKLVLDENHATDLAAPRGGSAPARGWIVELQSRADGIWGRVEWTGEGNRLMEDKAYRGVSPVILHAKDKTVTSILRASLTNAPNLLGLASLHQENREMDWKLKLIEALGLGGDVGDEDIVAALTAKLKAPSEEDAKAALQSTLAPIAKAAGLAETADAAAVLTGVTLLASKGGDQSGQVVALQSEIAGLTTKLTALSEAGATKDATAFVDASIREGRVGLKPVRDEYITMHAANPAHAEKLIKAMPILQSGNGLRDRDVDAEDHDDPQLLASDAAVYQRKLADAGQSITFATAVMAVKEGKHK